ncbi:Os04g0323800 [Oryza sativa Japonica Group]|uniref:Os04g0323800 protein n=2 Tax=Oryza sativa subsp. japonica TaxID=39947 RepID=Q0JE55_ORYSJ|nr:hypothetical protein EE612_023146 [Oryza sativa]KAF2933333.1 hypothetical protein DAI22_04g074600 [Oryza sativa Japonica Group]KAF2933334.1 hypothetical protein DAI22_04g074600 [Oryza sativa Japonica Group]KAF2933335.1 hypothetical protein DAI22_04g074600 [Oryza sativa Japonica Group]KAF2933337.1 hypothetical protein DAI22_04g074600 [Oryza sativa Japonica Group]|eukprot:NP_001052468.1 Os04g0323800 [Oryza sativa Japonica Group]
MHKSVAYFSTNQYIAVPNEHGKNIISAILCFYRFSCLRYLIDIHPSFAWFSFSEHFSFQYMKFMNEVTVVRLATVPWCKSISLDMEHALYGLLLIGCLDIT